jgi:Bacterial archaeo-eukaryotic release factor family 10
MKEPSGSDRSAVGVLLVSADGATIGEWHARRVEVLRKLELPVTEAAEHELLGPSYSHPRGSGEKATAARSSSQRDLWERRMDEHRVRFARSAAGDAAKIAKSRGWDIVLVLGDPRRAGPASEELEHARVRAVPIDSVLDWMRPAALAKRLAPEVEKARESLARSAARR